MNIIIDSLVPNQRKKQLMPDSTMEPPAGGNRKASFTSQTHNSLIYSPRERCRYNAGGATSKDIKHSIKRKAAIHHPNEQREQGLKDQREGYVIPNMLRRPILSMRRAETMFPGSTASVPRKLTK